jgi:alpha-tubulin suppressor-like RCC1 family protein
MKNRTGLVIPVLIAAAALLQACGDRMTCGKDDAGGCMTTDGGCPGCLCDSGGGADSGITADTGALDAGEADGGGDSGQTDGSADGGVLDGGSKSVLRISGGYDHTCALNSGGGVKCWGRNNVGQLGDGTTVDGLGAVQVAGLSSGVVSISAGFYHTCALLEGGFVKCWGYNYAGQLGDNSIDDKHMPVEVRGLPPGVVSVSAGFYHTCALTASGGVKCWGSNSNGQLGYGLGGSRSLPVDVDGLASGVKSVAACGFHTCAVLSPGGGVKCWGANGFGQIGDGATDQRYSPVDVSGMGSGVKSISGGGNHTCALLEGGGVKCWGLNSSGQVGDGTNENRKEPVGAAGLSSGVAGLSSNAVHTCALTENGDVKCWGGNAAGQLGDGTNIDRNLPTAPGVLPKGVAGVAAGGTHSCAILPTGGVACWGGNSYGQLGDGTTANKNVPVHMAGSPGAVAFSAAGYHTCSIDGDGGLKCWGANNYGQLGDGTSVLKSTPVEVAGLNAGAAEITGGELHTCALMKSGGIKCWGYNALGQLGDGTLLNRATPVDVPGLDGGVSSVQARGYHTCVIHGDGGVKCWGYNGQGQIGDGTNETRKAPTDVSGLTEGVNAIAAGFSTPARSRRPAESNAGAGILTASWGTELSTRRIFPWMCRA